jgi:chromosomal replication initiation ATPase DnaA
MSLPQIGRQMGRDHTTILYGVRKYQAMIDAGTIEP